jgi:hypothetical protein
MTMTRLTFALAAWMSFVSVASASLGSRKESVRELPRARAATLARQAPASAPGSLQQSEFVLTTRTEILLNGKPCRYQDVPGLARIVFLELAADQKTALRIHFRTGK